jgi:hypothetical protein
MITAKPVERLEVYIPVHNATEDTSPAFTTVSNPTAIGSSFGSAIIGGAAKWRLEIAPAGTCLISCVLKFAARSNAGQHNLRILQAIRLHQRIKRGGILRSDTHAAMRDGFAEILHFIAAVDPAVPVLGVFGSELVCALAGKVSSPSKKTTITGLGK